MPPWNQYRKKYSLESEDLPNPHLPTVVVIEGVESEDYTDPETNQPQTRHVLWLAGFAYPVRLNNAKVETLQLLLGENTEDAIGRKIAIIATVQTSYGKTVQRLGIHPALIPDETPPARVPFHLATKAPARLAQANAWGVMVDPPPARLQPGGSKFVIPGSQAPAAAQPSVKGSGNKLGAEPAAELAYLLAERNRNWDFLVSHFRANGMADLVSATSPPESDAACRGPAWNLIKVLPVTVRVDKAAFKAACLRDWAPPNVNSETGEINPDDIPF